MEFLGSINAVYVLVGSMALGASGGLLGAFAVLRKQGLLGDALAHASLPGIAVAFLIMQTKFLPGLLLGALVSGLLGALMIYFLISWSKIKMDTAMAAVLSVFFGIGILLLTYIQKQPLASQSGLESFLFGQAAALLKVDVQWILIAFFVILGVVLLMWKELKLFIFDQSFAMVIGYKRWVLEIVFMTIFVMSILMSLQAVGVVLTAALFITPAVSALLWSKRLSMVVLLSSLFGLVAGGVGALISAFFLKMPTGPVIVVVSSVIFTFSLFLAPDRGVISRWRGHRTHSIKVKRENLLARLYREHEKGFERWQLQDLIGRGVKMRVLIKFKAAGLIKLEDGLVFLNKKGLEEAAKVVEKHRLWETYLVNRMRLASDHVHRDAEEMEHILTDEMVAKLKAILKNPKKDPHGSPIR